MATNRGAASGARGGLAARVQPGARPPSAFDAGLRALADGRWADAATQLTGVAGDPATTPRDCRALEGLSDAQWWLGHVEDALAARERAFAGWRVLGDDLAAVRAAAWLAREYALAVGNAAVSQGWLARAETLAESKRGVEAVGWVSLTRALLAVEPRVKAAAARQARDSGRAAGSGDLEVLALGQLGLATVADGRLEQGLRCLDEAMAAATGGETDRATLAALCCDLVVASELSGELDRFAQWNDVVEALAARHGHASLVAFCATCCAEAFAASGDWSNAEQQLRGALAHLKTTGHRARCVAPAGKLADLLLSQGRIEEAERVLGPEEPDEALLARARLALARGDATAAVTLAERHVRRLGGPALVSAPALALLVEAQLEAGEHARARVTAGWLSAVGKASGHRRTLGRGLLAEAHVALAQADSAAARAALEAALDHLSAAAPGAVETAQARLELARLRADDAPQLAPSEARAALAGFESAGARHAADAAAALLRQLGDRSRVGDKGVGTLTRREEEVLRLLAQGLTNAEIAERLFISPKTAGNHVSHILAKLGLRSRVEAAAHTLQAEDR